MPLDKISKYDGNDFSFGYIIDEFNSTNRIIDKTDGKWVIAIDGRPVWGTDGNYPKTQVADIKIKIKGKDIYIHEVFFKDIFEVDNDFIVYRNGDTYFVHQWNSDGAGAYELVWVFDKNGLKQRFVGLMI